MAKCVAPPDRMRPTPPPSSSSSPFGVHRSPLVVRTWRGHSVVVRRAPALDISVAAPPHSHAHTYDPRTHVFAAAAFILQHKAQRLRSRTYGIARAQVSCARGAHRCYILLCDSSRLVDAEDGFFTHTGRQRYNDTFFPFYLSIIFRFYIIVMLQNNYFNIFSCVYNIML